MQNGVVMSKNWILLTGLLFLGSVEASQSHPLDSPDIVYIDGLPCNSACQSYMAWSRRTTSTVTRHGASVQSLPVESPPVRAAPRKPGLRPARSAVSRSTAVHRESSTPAKARIAKQATPLPSARVTPPQRAGDAAVNSEPAPANIAAPPPADDVAATSGDRTVQEQVAAATALAEQITAASAAPAPQQEAANAEASVQPEPTEPTVPAATDNADNRVAVLVARPEIESLSDLSGRDIAIEDQQSASSALIQAAIASAGAAEVQLNEKQVKAIDRLVDGEVPAAIVALVSPQAAEWFPDIPGYRIFRIPLSPGSPKARL
jgi:hypothetical protein